MGNVNRVKNQLIEQANKRLLHESVHDNESPIEGKSLPPRSGSSGSIPPIFISDVDKAIYSVYKTSQSQEGEVDLYYNESYPQWLTKDLGYTPEEIKKEGEKIGDYINKKIMNAGKEGDIPNPFGPDAVNIKVVVPVTAEEPLTNR